MIAAAAFVGLFVAAVAGCWLGAPPDQRDSMVREVRREWAIRAWQRQTRRETRR